MKTTLEKVHYAKSTLIHSLLYTSDSPNKFYCFPLRSSCILALQNLNLSPTIITRGFIFFFLHPQIENKLRKGIYYF